MALAEVAPVDERDREAVRGRRLGDAGAHDAAADHEQVESLGAEPLERGRPVYAVHRGFVQARRPEASSTSRRP